MHARELQADRPAVSGIVVSVAWSTVVTYIILKVFEGFEGLGVRG